MMLSGTFTEYPVNQTITILVHLQAELSPSESVDKQSCSRLATTSWSVWSLRRKLGNVSLPLTCTHATCRRIAASAPYGSARGKMDTDRHATQSTVQWYSGINYDCNVVDNADFFVVRVWEPEPPAAGGCGGSTSTSTSTSTDATGQCTPAVGTASAFHRPGVRCHDDIYDGGVLTATEDCERQIGRGSALVVSGCCQFWDAEGSAGCEGAPFLELAEGVCDDQIQLSNFTCVRVNKCQDLTWGGSLLT